MGLGSYFKAQKPTTNEKTPKLSTSPVSRDKELQPPTPRFNGSSTNSLSGRSVGSSAFLDDIKHEVMVNYIYQQQCARLWVSDGSGDIEGVLLRKSRNHYMACPSQLGHSAFAQACAALNVQVGLLVF